MPTTTATHVNFVEKISRIWSSKRECEIAVRIQYQMHMEGGCRVYQLSQTEELK